MEKIYFNVICVVTENKAVNRKAMSCMSCDIIPTNVICLSTSKYKGQAMFFLSIYLSLKEKLQGKTG